MMDASTTPPATVSVRSALCPQGVAQQLLPRRPTHAHDACRQRIRRTDRKGVTRHRRRYGYRRIHSELTMPPYHPLRHESGGSWRNGGCAPSSPNPTSPEQATGGLTNPRPTCSWTSPCRTHPTVSGRAISPISPPRRDGGIWPSSSTSAHAGSSAGSFATTCARSWSPPRSKSRCTPGAPRTGLVFHSNRGSQYRSRAHRTCLTLPECPRQSKSQPLHNAWTKSPMGTLKNEMSGGRVHRRKKIRIEIFDYIESYYNHHRKHSSLAT